MENHLDGVTHPMDEAQFMALMDAVHALADECAIAFMEARMESGDAHHLARMVGQCLRFLRPIEGREPPPAKWPTNGLGRWTNVPPLAVLDQVRRCGFTDEHVAKLLGCARQTLLKRRGGAATPRPSTRPWR